ncbi:Predicted dienelactone hydrolase [Roseibium suaedae]|uniref:Predicted dienelactone hydrolase n=2 Tax=Roseibium suaedae TaxID=735517 RepID=A0A1M7H967_9HYPH|nr:Predicted dienelactone hydrolase [Roseibium suaedae]
MALSAGLLLLLPSLSMAENRIDIVRPDAPALAAHGTYGVGRTTLELTNPDQADVPAVLTGDKNARRDRPLAVEVFYPAANVTPVAIDAMLRDGSMIKLHGRSAPDVAPDRSGAPYPLVIISHGYPGNRFLLSHLAENLATKGYVVASIDHTDSTYDNKGAFEVQLVNRPLDQKFVLEEMDRLSREEGTLLGGLLSAERTGLIGFSMGAYGAVISSGGSLTEEAVAAKREQLGNLLTQHRTGSAEHEELVDDRLKAVIAIAPWGRNAGYFSTESLSGLEAPALFVAGSHDDISGYEKGVRKIWEESVHSDRFLLTFEYANHNAAAPMPAPEESYAFNEELGFAPFNHYADPVWDTVRMNNVLQHFSTAFLGLHLKQNDEMGTYLDLIPNAGDGVSALDENGHPKPEHTYWRGFPARTAMGLTFEHLEPLVD